MSDYLIKTENMLFECSNKSALTKKVSALLTLGINFKVYKNYDKEYKPMLISANEILGLEVVK